MGHKISFKKSMEKCPKIIADNPYHLQHWIGFIDPEAILFAQLFQ